MDKEYIKSINPDYENELEWKARKWPVTIGIIFGVTALLFFVIIMVLLIIN